jgi:hypothetical protein
MTTKETGVLFFRYFHNLVGFNMRYKHTSPFYNFSLSGRLGNFATRRPGLGIPVPFWLLWLWIKRQPE